MSNTSINMVTAVLVSVSCPPLSPSVKATAPTKNIKRQWDGLSKEARATDMQAGVLTQVLTIPSLGTLYALSVLDLSMSVDTPAACVRVKDTPKTSVRCATTGCDKKKTSVAAGENSVCQP